MNWLLDIDTQILLFLNRDLDQESLTTFFQILTDFHRTLLFKFILLPFLILFCLYKKRKKALIPLLSFFIAIGISDGFASQVVKKSIQRLRPAPAGIEVIVKAPVAGQYSFYSNHASNIFAAATFMSLLFPAWWGAFFIFASLVALSRPYLGVHYPLDIVAGALIGTLWGYLGFYLKRIWERRVYGQSPSDRR